jgi:hypothetical protein
MNLEIATATILVIIVLSALILLATRKRSIRLDKNADQ